MGRPYRAIALGQQAQALGRSRGGFSTKIHIAVPVSFSPSCLNTNVVLMGLYHGKNANIHVPEMSVAPALLVLSARPSNSAISS